MDQKHLEELLTQVQKGGLSVEEATLALKKLPFEDLGYAKIDNHRSLRNGVPEVIYCEGKSPEHIRGIVPRLAEHSANVLATRASEEVYQVIKEVYPACRYNKSARIVLVNPQPVVKKGSIVVAAAGTSDIPVAEEAAATAEVIGNNVKRIYDVGVAGIHRLLEYCEDLYTANVVVAVAGMEGALASVVGGLVSCPVIAVPTSIGYGTSFGGVAALLSMLNSCASGLSVVNIDNGFGAGYQASLINQLAVKEPKEEEQEREATEINWQ
ncbi:nickel pincer cofactor biosynthesis protein LarB [Dethiosulfatarculus sandiegensis]|uniref:1-(5-phosphoribosyl)-5-amino-4-imidazole-carboxylate carboxylase n=1 Tax=Dethiosulfatarculus sandiegensis TaxID=1429043 RepID=A0A0D2HNJ9_9BACT|nr:nickel pincer cofactor biosynthesis protein LarB [Dethiosulfatarculus sandiegensis]KIX12143.1 1-(5-phosphoribosyl)-5-amino-4-imidazole-carboxylate carboxylase [Dethiosulfatarculus sandiegensis]